MAGAIFEVILNLFIHKISVKIKIILGIIIISIFSLSIYLSRNKYDNQKKRNTQNEMSVIEENILSFKRERGRLPYSLKELTGSNPLKSEWLDDGWGSNYSYEVTDSISHLFILKSNGPNARKTEDDIIIVHSPDPSL